LEVAQTPLSNCFDENTNQKMKKIEYLPMSELLPLFRNIQEIARQDK
jgi:hypothetical protein